MKTKLLLTLLTPCIAAALAGCQVSMKHSQFAQPMSAPKGAIAISSRAENIHNRIGSGTFTVFAIPIAPVNVNGDAERDLMTQVKDAAQHSGYTVKMVETSREANDLPILSCHVDEFKFKNYTYFFPIVFNWGNVQMHLLMTQPDGRVVWYRSYNGHANGTYSFQSTVTRALTRTLDQMIPELAAANPSAPAGKVCPTLRVSDPEQVITALKALRRLNAPDAVPEILPLLQHKNSNVVRDSCRTLAVLGNKETIPSIEPLLNDRRSDVRKDAQDAIVKLREKL